MLRCSPQLTAGRSGGDRTHSGGTGRAGPAARAARGRWCPQSRPGRPQRRRGRPKPGTSRGRRGPFTLLAVKTRRTRARAALVSRGWAAGLGRAEEPVLAGGPSLAVSGGTAASLRRAPAPDIGLRAGFPQPSALPGRLRTCRSQLAEEQTPRYRPRPGGGRAAEVWEGRVSPQARPRGGGGLG